MSEVLLPIAATPITSFLYKAFALVVLLNYPECFAWFYSNYIQLEYYKDRKGETLSFVGAWFTDIPWLQFQYMKKEEFVTGTGDLNQTIRDIVEDGWYFYSWFDEFFVPQRSKFNKVHSSQDFLLFGYHDHAENYSILGYSDRGIIEITKISYFNFLKAYESAYENNYEDPPCVILFKKRPDFDFKFEMKYLYEMLLDYAQGRDTGKRIGLKQRDTLQNRIFGLSAYDCLSEYFQLISDKQVNHHRALYRSARSLHVLWEHKKCMLLRLEYLHQQGLIDRFDYFYSFYQKIENAILSLRNTQLNYSLREERNLLEKIMESLQEIKKQESDVLEELLEMIQKKLP
ncbi:MAG TPA: hypothetical protein VHY08_15520 [Bacillota bacterium]|nr:hypothetical protein [Bacillota bacterium]